MFFVNLLLGVHWLIVKLLFEQHFADDEMTRFCDLHFIQGTSITYSQFDHFVKSRPEAFDLSAWLLREHLPARREERPANGPGLPPSAHALSPNGSIGGTCTPHRFRLALTDRDSASYKPTFHETLEEITQCMRLRRDSQALHFILHLS